MSLSEDVYEEVPVRQSILVGPSRSLGGAQSTSNKSCHTLVYRVEEANHCLGHIVGNTLLHHFTKWCELQWFERQKLAVSWETSSLGVK